MMTEIGLDYETLGTLTYNEAKKNILSAVKKSHETEHLKNRTRKIKVHLSNR